MARDDELFAPGHRACPGCGAAIAVRWILKATGRDVIVVTPTGCVETFASPYLLSPWEVAWLHPLFENAAAVASGISAALRYKGQAEKTKVVIIAGDGATFDIGAGAISGMLERNEDITYICYDNEAYMNTGFQRSAATPERAATTTEPPGKMSLGKVRPKKDMPSIAVAHGSPYVATASIAYPIDLYNKVTKALKIKGAKYIQVHSPCCTGWGFSEDLTIEMGRLAVETALAPLYEIENGQLSRVRKIKNRRPVEDYLKPQRRFRHLFQDGAGAEEIKRIQAIADANASRFSLDA